ncbi:hypothetical protein ASD11_12460 [Aeromicrobium sp. Root495]|uniref:type II secretion system F family protein n=1 Tax=Aeromicrobium sp. Root495 TaxID=1736550 RepID=UPI0006FFE1ED|nr:type II secretion system F family protein [Aeromicrobium sp. Root495]KQY60269.1 hypothetical protein ASD11_12460 [Aeromicrobium sp. Root495]
MIAIAFVFIFSAIFLGAVGTGAIALPSGSVRSRIKQLTAAPESSTSTSGVIKVDDSVSGFWEKFTPSSMLKKVEHNMVLAGRPPGWSRERVVLMKPVGAIFGTLFAVLVIAKTDSFMITLFGIGAVVLGYFAPDLLMYNQAIKRQEEIQKSLPDMLDQIVISLEAGVGFEAALSRSGERGKGPLADEVVRLVQDMSLGMSRREAYIALSDRTSVAELRSFCKAVVQAEEFGVSIASVVRMQAKEMRLGRRLRAEAKAQQVPVKILIPLMLLILPVLFIIVMGPPVVNAYAIN